jgi:mitochondrial protein import protein ZIM17
MVSSSTQSLFRFALWASRASTSATSARLISASPIVAPLQPLRRSTPRQAPWPSTTFFRAAHTIPKPPPTSPSAEASSATPKTQTQTTSEFAAASEGERPPVKNPDYYQLSFTCIPCDHRSHHNVSKQGYHRGSVLISCPNCRNRHVISDHLDIFGDRKFTIEDLMREKGQLVKRGTLGEDGDIEFWPVEKAESSDSSSSSA